MRIINIINLKGGVGKTTTALEMGYILQHKYGYAVLLVDNDKQGNLSRGMDLYTDSGICPTARLLLGEPVQDLIHRDGIDTIAANMSLLTATYRLASGNAADRTSRYLGLRSARTLTGTPYDYVIIDNPPDLGINVINALMAANDVIIPTKIDQWALEGLDIIRDQIVEIKQVNPRIRLAEALVTMYRNTPACAAGLDWLHKHNYDGFNTVIRYSEKAAECTFFTGQSLQDYSPRSAAAVSYRRFVAEYLRRTS